MKIKILAEDIQTATYSNPDDCPIARAIKRAGHTLRLGVTTIAYTDNKVYNVAIADEVVRKMYRSIAGEGDYLDYRWGVRFSDSLPVKDFEIELKETKGYI